MRIVHLTASLSRNAGGIYDAVRGLAKGLQLRGHEVHAIGLSDDNDEADLPTWGAVDTNALPVRGPKLFGFAPDLSRKVYELQPDVLHTHGLWMYPSVVSRNWSKRTGKPLVISPHGMLDPWAVRNSRWKKRVATLAYERSHLARAGAIHALCATEAKAIRAFGLSNTVVNIPNAVELPSSNESKAPAPWSGRIDRQQKILLYLARIHPKKGLLELVHGVRKAIDRNGFHKWSLAVVGWDDGGHLDDIKRTIRELKLGHRVHLLGPLFGRDKSAALNHADAFILPSFSEGLPMAVLEAWSHELPVIMTDHCNIPQGFDHKAAIRIQPSPESIADGLLHLASMQDGSREDTGRRGRQLVEEQYTWDRVAGQMIQLYEWLLGQGSLPSFVHKD